MAVDIGACLKTSFLPTKMKGVSGSSIASNAMTSMTKLLATRNLVRNVHC